MSTKEELAVDFISHYGKKGMRWGVRTKSKGSSTKGFSKDAKKATTIRAKAKKSPVKVKSLSNDEINTFLTRVSLETRFSQATPSNTQKTLRAVKSILGIGSTMNDVAKFSNSESGQAIKKGLKKAKAKPKDS